MGVSRRTGARPAAAALAAAALLGGCALDVGRGLDRVTGVARYAFHYDHPLDPQANLLDRALAGCAEKTVKAETACVREGVDAAHVSAQALMALVPGCRAGQVCRYDHATRDRLGLVEATAVDYVKRWRVDLDFRTGARDGAQVPITVTDRDDFGPVPTSAPPVPTSAPPVPTSAPPAPISPPPAAAGSG